MARKTTAEQLDDLDAAVADLRRQLIAAIPPRFVALFWRAARISYELTPRWPAWLRAGLGTFGLLEGIVLSNMPGGEWLGLGAALFGLWLVMGALRDL